MTMYKKNFFQRMRMPLPELEEYYRRCRKEAFWGNVPIRGMKVRKLIHPLLLLAVRVRMLISRGLNGAICCDTSSKSDRHIGKETCIRLLNQGGSLLIYPEGAWNILENQVVMPLYTGAVEMAIRTGVQNVPVAIEEYGKHYYVNIGRNINLADFSLGQKQEATDLLRDTLSP